MYIDKLVTHKDGIMNTDRNCVTLLIDCEIKGNTDELCDERYICEH